MALPARSTEQRVRDARHRLQHDVDAWVATADPESGTPYLVPLSFLWDGETLLIATPASSPTARNLHATGTVRLGIGPTRDVVSIAGTVRTLAAEELTPEVGDAFAAKTGFDPRQLSGQYHYFRIEPTQIQVWREEIELEGRTVMRDGRWLGPESRAE